MAIDASDWQELGRLTIRLDELRNQLEIAEVEGKIATICALEEEIVETEDKRAQVFGRLHDRLIQEAAA